MKAYIEQLMDYNYWANGLILKYTEKLPIEQYLEVSSYRPKSLAETLGHILLAEMVWLERMQGAERDSEALKKALAGYAYPTVRALYEDWFDVELEMRAFLAELTEAQLGSPFSYQRSDGGTFTNQYADIFTQLAFHGMQHRGECALILTSYGHSPGNLDYITYLRP
ncbi:MAG: DinB family protein [Anaerolineales bacterium]|jgi:uncharacterized damage-inducible protein DinB